jgi:hypothetical protein
MYKQALHEAAATSVAAGLALEMFCHSVRKPVAGILTAQVRGILREAQAISIPHWHNLRSCQPVP